MTPSLRKQPAAHDRARCLAGPASRTIAARRFFGALSVLSLAACATNPVTGRRELSLISQDQEIAMGREASRGDVARVGEFAAGEAQALVKRIGVDMAAKSERPGLPWEFHLLDDAAVNAFAYPGGFIFVTRGLMTHLNSEAELAEVIGHEIGHVTAKHTVTAMSNQQITQIGLIGASILSPQVAKFGDVLGASASMLFLKFGREDELQSDALGFRYSLALGYDVRESPKVFTTLGRLSGSAGARIPEWQSTHPDPGNRVARAEQRIATLPPNSLTAVKVNRDGYLRLLDGMVFGENPRQGYFKATRFLHPDLRFEMTFPTGWKTANLPDAVIGQSADGGAQLQLAPGEGTPAQTVQKFLAQQGITTKQSGNTTINGIPAVQASFDATTQEGTLNGLIVSLQHRNTTYMLLAISAPQASAQQGPVMETAIRSFRDLSDPTLINVQPARVQLVSLTEAMTAQTFVQRFPSSIPAEQVFIINGVVATTQLPRGTLMKRVVGGIQ
ncbi:MAG: M48 family metalloprotease [Gemmatimonadaceae bacterium]|nr:M48 family metalloprotease [Gemmatimonadaceae bacterium]